MKTLIIFLFVVATTTLGQAQEVTRLGEVNIGFTPLNTEIIKTENGYKFVIDNLYSTDFTSNPIAFMHANFDIKNFITALDDNKYTSYIVAMKSNKGSMVAKFDEDGNLISTRQNFKNLLLPFALRLDVYKNYKGWTMTKNKYRATTKGEIITNETYLITLQNGKRKQKIKINSNKEGVNLASN